jgi:hypothetical protein
MGKQTTSHAIDDAALHAQMNDGTIVIVDGLTSPRVVVRGVELKPELNEQGGRVRIFGATRYRVEIRHKGKRRKITLNRIVWLWYFGAIPAGADIHHGPAGKYVDGLCNLDCMSEEDHLAFHYGANVDDSF